MRALILGILLGLVVVTPVGAQEGGMPGDLNGDGRVNVIDATLSLQIAVGNLTPSGAQKATGDVNGDGQLNIADTTLILRAAVGLQPLSSPTLTTLVSTSPANGENDVAVTRETIFRLSAPLSPSATLDDAAVYASFGGQKLPGNLHLSPDGRTLTLFYTDPHGLPPSATIQVVLVGDRLPDIHDRALDADGDGHPGGTATVAFETLSLTALPGTTVVGRVFASELAAGMNTPLQGATITVDGQPEKLRAVTDANGSFRLDPAPVGHFFVHIDGRTATNGMAPGDYYPFVGKEWASVPGQETNIGDVYLPLIKAGTLQPVSPTQNTEIRMAPSVVMEHPEFAGVKLEVPAGSLYSEDGTRGGMVGIAPVPPDRLPGPLPAGLALPLVTTVQSTGTDFDVPAPVCFPNLPDPDTHQIAAPGAKNALVSYNHKKGDWEVVGSMTVSADDQVVCSDAGSGILKPGWHGTAPCPDTPPPPPDQCGNEPANSCQPPPLPNALERPVVVPLQSGGPPAACPTPRPPCPYKDNAACQTECQRRRDRDTGTLQRWYGDVKEHSCKLRVVSPPPEHIVYEDACMSRLITRYRQYEKQVNGGYNQCIDSCEANCKPSTDQHPGLVAPAPLPLQSTPNADPVVALEQRGIDLVAPLLLSGVPVPASTWAAFLALDQQIDALTGGSPVKYLTDLGVANERQYAGIYGSLATDPGNAPPYPVLYAATVRRDGTDTVYRGWTGPGGNLSVFVGRGAQLIDVRIYDPKTQQYGTILPYLDPAAPYRLPYIRLFPLEPDEIDSDRDGLADIVEDVYGTDPNKRDTYGLGVTDGQAVALGLIPNNLKPVQTGIIAAANLPGTAVDIAAYSDRVAVATDAGVSVFSVYNGMDPKILAQVPTPQPAHALAFSGDLLVVADGTAGVSVIDLSDPPSARITQQVDLGAGAVAVTTDGALAYAGLDDGKVAAVDPIEGYPLDRIDLLSGPIQDLAMVGDTLYALTDGTFGAGLPATLYALPHPENGLAVASATTVPGSLGAGGRRLRLFGGGSLLYVTQTQGYDTFDLSDPAHPVLITGGTTTQFGWRQIVPNGSGPGALGLAAVGNNSVDDGAHDVSLYDLGDPQQTNRFLTTFPMPGSAVAVSIYNGLGYVADAPTPANPSSGLEVVSYLPYDSKKVPPTISLSTNAARGSVEEGQIVRVTADAHDDVQVRNVEFYVNDQKVATAGSFPFEFRGLVPAAASTPTLRVRARASDTGGNATWSEERTLQVIADTTPFGVQRVFPADSALIDPAWSLGVIVSRPIRAETLSDQRFTLTAAGPDGQIGTADDVPVPGGRAVLGDQARRAALVFAAPLPVGLYRATLAAAVMDTAGRSLGASYSWGFRIVPPTDLAPTAVTLPKVVTSTTPNPMVEVSWTVRNNGSTALPSWTDALYVSTKPTLDSDAAGIWRFGWDKAVLPEATYTQTQTVTLPLSKGGDYYLLVKANDTTGLKEQDHTNNVLAVPFTFNLTPADLKPTKITLPGATITPGSPNPTLTSNAPNPTVDLSWTVANIGTGATLANQWRDIIGVSAQPTLDSTARFISQTGDDRPAVPPGGSYTVSLTSVRLPVTASGTYYLLVETNFDGVRGQYESDYDNNVLAVPITFNLMPPDLKLVKILAPASVTGPNPTFDVSWTVANTGTGATTPGLWRDLFYFSTKPTLDETARALVQNGPYDQSIPPGGSYTTPPTSVRLPVTASGTYYLLVKVNYDEGQYEPDYDNNVVAVPIVVM